MPTLYEIRASDHVNATVVSVVQVELRPDGKRAKGVTMADADISRAISAVVQFVAMASEATGWITYHAIERWLTSWGSRAHYFEVGVDWDPRDDMPSTHPLDLKLTNAVQELGRRTGHKPLPVAVAQVIEAYILASEYVALVDYLKTIDAQTAGLML